MMMASPALTGTLCECFFISKVQNEDDQADDGNNDARHDGKYQGPEERPTP